MQKPPERRAKQSSFPANDFEVKAYNLQQFSDSLNLFSLSGHFSRTKTISISFYLRSNEALKHVFIFPI